MLIHYIMKTTNLWQKMIKEVLVWKFFQWTHDKIFVSLSEKLTYLNSNSVLVTWFSTVVEHENCRYIYVHFFFCIGVCKHFGDQSRNVCRTETYFFRSYLFDSCCTVRDLKVLWTCQHFQDASKIFCSPFEIH